LPSLCPFLVVNLRNSLAITIDKRLDSEQNEPHLSFVQNESELSWQAVEKRYERSKVEAKTGAKAEFTHSK